MSDPTVDDVDREIARRSGGSSPDLAAVDAELAKRGANSSPSFVKSVMDVAKFGIPAYNALGVNKALDHFAYEAGGKVTDAAAKVLPPEGAAAAGFAANVGIQAIPTVAGALAAKYSEAPSAIDNWARGWMQSALKPSKSASVSGKADKAITTLLDEGVNVSPGGLETLNSKIGELNSKVEDAINRYPFGRVNKAEVANELRPVFEKYVKAANPQADMEAINTAFTRFMDHPLLQGSSQIPVQLAQEMKQGTYRSLGNKAYGANLPTDAERDAQKALAAGLRKGVAAEVPGIDALNSQEGALINAANLVEDRLATAGNRNKLGLGILNPKTLGYWLLDRSELAKSLIARGLHGGREAIPTAAGAAIGGAEGAYMGRRLRDSYQQEDKK